MWVVGTGRELVSHFLDKTVWRTQTAEMTVRNSEEIYRFFYIYWIQ